MSSLSLYANLSSLPSSLTIRSSSSKGTSLHNNPFNFSFSPCIVAYILCFSSLLNHLFFSSFLWSRHLFETGLEDKVQTYPTRWHIPSKRSLQVYNYMCVMCYPILFYFWYVILSYHDLFLLLFFCDSRCGLCDTYYIAHVKNACAFLGDGMSNIEVSLFLNSIACISLPFDAIHKLGDTGTGTLSLFF